MSSTKSAPGDAAALRADPRFALGQSIGLAAFVWGYPLVETLRTCALQTGGHDADDVAWHLAIDRLHHVQRAATAAERDIVTPANDLLYTTAWINLANGPRLLHVPASAEHHGRYFVLALYDAWTNNFENPGLRTSPSRGETVLLVGPDHPAHGTNPPGVRVVHAPTNLVWMIGRIVVGDGQDRAAAQRLQSQIRLECPAGTDSGGLPLAVQRWVGPTQDCIAALEQRPVDAPDIAAAFFANLCHALSDAALPAADEGLANWFTRAKLVAGTAFDWTWLEPALRAGLQQGLLDGSSLVISGSRSHVARPWAASFALGRYGSNYLVRALTAYKGLGALDSREAVYAMGDFDADKQPLTGEHRYRLRFEAADLPPVDAFWSVTMYGADRFLVPNSMQRFSIGDRTAGLRTDPDGGLTLLLQHAPPADTANWLPAPRGGFYVILRLYCPRAETRTWRIPPLCRVEAVSEVGHARS